MSSPLPVDALRETLSRRLDSARCLTDSLFQLLSPQALLCRPIPERHRILFYLGHLEAFDWNLLGRTTFEMEPFNEEFDRLFAFGIDPVDGALPDDVPSDWPSRRQIDEYVRDVRRRTDRLLADAPLETGDGGSSGKIFEVAIEHRLMHAETLTYMLHWLPADVKHAPSGTASIPVERPSRERRVPIPHGTATLGMRSSGPSFGWDNEFDLTKVEVPAFTIDAFDVTNAQFLEFVRRGGYSERGLWSEAGWAWKCAAGIEHPRFWEKDGNEWLLRTMFGRRPLPGSWPVYVSHAEASAYACWDGKTLPTEAQIHRAAYGTPEGTELPYPWGAEPPAAKHGNFNFQRWDPVPVGSYPAGDSAFGVSDLLGNGWEWTSTVFEPFQGFRRFEFYPGYSADFFDAGHFVMKGGSSRTAACMLRRSFRNWFQPHYPHIYATFRCVQS